MPQNVFTIKFTVVAKRPEASPPKLVGDQLNHLLTLLSEALAQKAEMYEFSFEPTEANIKRVET